MNTTNNRLSQLAESLINSSKNTLCGELRPLYRGISNFPHKETEEYKVFTDGNFFYYSPKYILTKFKEEKTYVNRLFLHSLFHCIFLHIYKVDFKNRELWDLACDICVEKTINDCNLNCTTDESNINTKQIIARLSKRIKNFTAENIYLYLLNSPLSKDDISDYKAYFYGDCHDVWYSNNALINTDESEDVNEVEARSIYKYADDRTGDYQEGKKQVTGDTVNSHTEKTEEDWRETTKRIIRDTETSPSVFGISSGFDTLILKSVTRDSYDYSEFLKSFIQLNEQLEINDDEFDYIYYTYGLNLYGNVPLIEPLEYSENTKLQRLIIAIDTSGSVYGEPVKKFIEKTYNILKNTEFFNKDFEIHIIQCDCEIQSVDIIHSHKELEEYIKHLALKGFGGTDFRPVFQYAEEILKSDKNKTFNGLIYFTDGDGIYPEKVPEYKNAFVIHDNGFDKNKMPVWATPIYLETNDIYKTGE